MIYFCILCAVDIDECRDGTHQCRYNQICENTRGSYHCTCPRGYRSQGVGRPCLGTYILYVSHKHNKTCIQICMTFKGLHLQWSGRWYFHQTVCNSVLAEDICQSIQHVNQLKSVKHFCNALSLLFQSVCSASKLLSLCQWLTPVET